MSDNQNKISVERTINASSDAIFHVLSNPERHQQLDAAGFIQSVEKGQRIQGTGEVFTMNMAGDHMGGEYKTDNHVVGFEPNKLIAWKTAPAGTEPKGWQWVWELESQGSDSTLVRHTYDWSGVTDEALLAKGLFPLLSEQQLDESVRLLGEAVTGS